MAQFVGPLQLVLAFRKPLGHMALSQFRVGPSLGQGTVLVAAKTGWTNRNPAKSPTARMPISRAFLRIRIMAMVFLLVDNNNFIASIFILIDWLMKMNSNLLKRMKTE